jgi:D-alanyl-D-alanine carboxypeptidase
MKNCCILFFAAFAFIGCTNTKPDYNAKKIEQLVSQLVANKTTVGVAYSLQIGSVISAHKAFGFDDWEKKTTIRENAQFRIASMTKPFTATAIMQLIEKGNLSLTDSIAKFFPNLANASKITVYQLLAHTSGIPNWFEAEMPKDEPKEFPMCKNPHTYIERMGIQSLFEPGTHHAYSNTGYILLGEIIEIVSGESYFDYLKTHILLPANMVDTEMEYVEHPSPNWVKGYAYNPALSNPFTQPAFYHMPFSAGGLRSSTADVMKFMEALQAGKLVSKESFEKMTSYAVVNNGQPVYAHLFSPSGQSPQFPSNIKKWGYGLGFQIIENFGTKVISHGGDIAGFNAVLMLIPKSNTKMVILANTENGILSKLRDIEKAATDIALEQ